jgi:hypothetical protein
MLYACALCGEPWPLGPEYRANLSGTSWRAILPCPCETRAPRKPEPPIHVPPSPANVDKLFESMSPDEWKALFEGHDHERAVQKAVDAELKRDDG